MRSVDRNHGRNDAAAGADPSQEVMEEIWNMIDKHCTTADARRLKKRHQLARAKVDVLRADIVRLKAANDNWVARDKVRQTEIDGLQTGKVALESDNHNSKAELERLEADNAILSKTVEDLSNKQSSSLYGLSQYGLAEAGLKRHKALSDFDINKHPRHFIEWSKELESGKTNLVCNEWFFLQQKDGRSPAKATNDTSGPDVAAPSNARLRMRSGCHCYALDTEFVYPVSALESEDRDHNDKLFKDEPKILDDNAELFYRYCKALGKGDIRSIRFDIWMAAQRADDVSQRATQAANKRARTSKE